MQPKVTNKQDLNKLIFSVYRNSPISGVGIYSLLRIFLLLWQGVSRQGVFFEAGTFYRGIGFHPGDRIRVE